MWRSVVTFGPLVAILISFVGVILHSGLVGDCFDDWVLEWLGRVRGWITLYSLVYTAYVGISLFGPDIVDIPINAQTYRWVKWSALAGWLLTTLGGVLSGKSTNTSGEQSSAEAPLFVRLLTLLGPPMFAVGSFDPASV